MQGGEAKEEGKAEAQNIGEQSKWHVGQGWPAGRVHGNMTVLKGQAKVTSGCQVEEEARIRLVGNGESLLQLTEKGTGIINLGKVNLILE